MSARAEAAQSTADGILDVAIELFTDKPFEDVTLDDVAERAGVTKRTVLRRFESKDRLFRHRDGPRGGRDGRASAKRRRWGTFPGPWPMSSSTTNAGGRTGCGC